MSRVIQLLQYDQRQLSKETLQEQVEHRIGVLELGRQRQCKR